MKEVFLTAGFVFNKSWRVLFGREIPTRRLPLMPSIQEQAKREFGRWMDGWMDGWMGVIRITWSRYLLRLLAKKRKSSGTGETT